MGYFIFVILALGLLAFAVIAATRGSKKPPSGRIAGEGAILRETPSADAPTPAGSATAPKHQQDAAAKTTPPA